MPADIKKEVVVDVIANDSKANKTISDLQERVESNPINLTLSADITNILTQVKRLESNTMRVGKSFSKYIKDIGQSAHGLKFTSVEKSLLDIQDGIEEVVKTIGKINLEDIFSKAGTGGVKEFDGSLKSIGDTIDNIARKMNVAGNAFDIEAKIKSSTAALRKEQEEINKTINVTPGRANKSVEWFTKDVNIKKVQKLYKNIDNEDLFTGKGSSGAKSILENLIKASQSGSDLSQTIKISETESVSLREIFDDIYNRITSAQKAGESLGDTLKRIGLNDSLIGSEEALTQVKKIADARKEIQRLESDLSSRKISFDPAVLDNVIKKLDEIKDSIADIAPALEKVFESGINVTAIDKASEKYKELSTEIEKAEAKLENLKKEGVSLSELIKTDEGKDNTFKKIVDEMTQLDNELKGMGDNLPADKVKRFLDLYTTIYENFEGYARRIPEKLHDRYGKYTDLPQFEDYEPGSISGFIDDRAVREQEQLVDRLKKQREELKKTEEAELPIEKKSIGIEVDLESARAEIEKIKGLLDEIPDKKEIEIKIRDYSGVDELRDAAGEIVEVYRAVSNVYGGSYNSTGTFFSSKKELAAQYGDKAGGNKLYSANLKFTNPFEIDANGADHDAIEFLGFGYDEVSQKIIECSARIKELNQQIQDPKNAKEVENLKKQLEEQKRIYKEISDDVTNMYGTHSTDEWISLAAANGYDGAILRNVYDGFNGDGAKNPADLSDLFVPLFENQIVNVKTIAGTKDGFEKSLEQVLEDSKDAEIEITVDNSSALDGIRKVNDGLAELPDKKEIVISADSSDNSVSSNSATLQQNPNAPDQEHAVQQQGKLQDEIRQTSAVAENFSAVMSNAMGDMVESTRKATLSQMELRSEMERQDFNSARLADRVAAEAVETQQGLDGDSSAALASSESHLDGILESLKEINKELAGIHSSLGRVDEGSGFTGLISQLDTVLERLLEIKDKVGTGIINVDIGNSTQGKAAESAVNNAWSSLANRYMGVYDRMEKIATDMLGTTYDKPLSGLIGGVNYVGNDVSDLYYRTAITSIQDPKEQVRRLTKFIKEIQKIAKEWSEVDDVDGIYKPFIDEVNASRSRLETNFARIEKRVEALYSKTPDINQEVADAINQSKKVNDNDISTIPQGYDSNEAVIRAEQEALVSVREILDKIATAIEVKTQAFTQEKLAVDTAVQHEISLLRELIEVLDEVSKAAVIDFKLGEDGGAIAQFKSTLDSIVTSFNSIEVQDAGFNGLTKLLNSLSGNNGAQKIEKLVSLMSKLKETLNTPVDENALVKSIESIANSGNSLKDLAIVLKATKSEIAKAQEASTAPTAEQKAQRAEATKTSKAYYDSIIKNLQETKKLEVENAKIRAGLIKDDDGSKLAENQRQIIEMRQKNSVYASKIVELDGRDVAQNQKILDLTEEITRARSKAFVDASSKVNEGQKVKDDKIRTNIESQYEDYIKRIQSNIDRGQSTNQLVDEYKSLLKEAANFKEQFNESMDMTKAQAEWDKLANKMDETLDKGKLADFKKANESTIASIRMQIERYISNNSGMGSEFMVQFDKLRMQFDATESIAEANKLKAAFMNLRAEVDKAGASGRGFLDVLKERITGLNAQFIAYFFSWQDYIRYFREALTVITEYNTAYTEMRKVSDESVSSLRKYQSESFNVAGEIGTTALALQTSTADFLRLGENLTDAAQSAKDATVLLNVSEFGNINEATEALVSASQAFTDLEKMDIIDVLNEIGNNYPTSTNKLATGLQNAAAVLQTQGNDIYESVALLTAGDVITQDMSKTSMGIRTIALRIAGTKEAKDELKSLGEDVDDFIVGTASKTQQTIKNFTAVRSNDFKGVDVLDPNGNLRNTYDILLDISKVYKEIQETDKIAGTNRAQALVETLAGKTRSNIAASILTHPELLEQVYESAQNAEGSAYKELNKYLDSIEGRVAQFKNAVEHLEVSLINDQFIADTVSGGTAIVKILDAIIERLGGLPTLMGAALGAFATFQKVGKTKCTFSSINVPTVISFSYGYISFLIAA